MSESAGSTREGHPLPVPIMRSKERTLPTAKSKQKMPQETLDGKGNCDTRDQRKMKEPVQKIQNLTEEPYHKTTGERGSYTVDFEVKHPFWTH